MKLKYYLRGLGTGILVTTLILFIAYSYRDVGVKEKDTDKDNKTNVEQSSTSDDEKNSTSESSSSTEESSSSEETTPEATTPEETTTPEATTPEETTPEETTVAPPVVDDTNTVVEFTIYSGYTSWDVAMILEQTGVVESAADFDYYLAVNGYDYRISTGVYTVKIGATYEEIAEMITY